MLEPCAGKLASTVPRGVTLSNGRCLLDYVEKNLIVTYAVYFGGTNPHAQLQVSRRSVNEDGSFSWAKNREMCSKKALLETRTFWAELTNRYLEADEVDVRITEKSFAERGIDRNPARHRGRIASEKLRTQNNSRSTNTHEISYANTAR